MRKIIRTKETVVLRRAFRLFDRMDRLVAELLAADDRQTSDSLFIDISRTYAEADTEQMYDEIWKLREWAVTLAYKLLDDAWTARSTADYYHLYFYNQNVDKKTDNPYYLSLVKFREERKDMYEKILRKIPERIDL